LGVTARAEEDFMNVRLLFALLLMPVSDVAIAQTAREYFSELRDLNHFTRYSDEYVCFHDEDKGGFAVIARTKDIETRMAAARKAGTKIGTPLGDKLVVQKYFKGVANDPAIYEKIDKNSDEGWGLKFDSPIHGKTVYLMNWTTGRYRFLVYALDRSKTVPASEMSGKCELIHPWVSPLSK